EPGSGGAFSRFAHSSGENLHRRVTDSAGPQQLGRNLRCDTTANHVGQARWRGCGRDDDGVEVKREAGGWESEKVRTCEDGRVGRWRGWKVGRRAGGKVGA